MDLAERLASGWKPCDATNPPTWYHPQRIQWAPMTAAEQAALFGRPDDLHEGRT